MSSGYRGGGGRGRGRGRSSSGGRGGGGRGPPGGGEAARLRPCSEYTTKGSCSRGNSCGFAHVVRLHASIDASTAKPTTQQQRYHTSNRYNDNSSRFFSVSSVSIWETQGTIKIFTGSHDGFWRLWNTQGGTFQKEFEHQIGKVECVVVASNFLFCGFEAVSLALPEVKVGMIHAWNLARPTDPPLEFHLQSNNMIPYAHAGAVTTITVEGDMILSGGRDGSVRVWKFDAANNRFVLHKSLNGHAGQVTGLQLVDSLLWSSSVDRSIRLWNLTSGECQYVISTAKPQVPGNPAQQTHSDKGHTNAVTGLLKFTSPNGTFVLSSSLDGTVKAWNGANGECVATESHGEGVVSMALSTDLQNNPILLIGVERGDLMVRNLNPTTKTPAFCLLMKLSPKYTAGHEGAVKSICSGPSSTFYSGGDDGKLLVWQFTGDLGI